MFYPLPQSGRVLAVFGCYYLIYLRWGGGEFNLSPASSLPNTSYIEKHETQPINSWFNWIKNSILYSEFKKQNFIFFIIIFYRIPYKILNFKGPRFTIGQQCIFTNLLSFIYLKNSVPAQNLKIKIGNRVLAIKLVLLYKQKPF